MKSSSLLALGALGVVAYLVYSNSGMAAGAPGGAGGYAGPGGAGGYGGAGGGYLPPTSGAGGGAASAIQQGVNYLSSGWNSQGGYQLQAANYVGGYGGQSGSGTYMAGMGRNIRRRG